jgi:hypothetical protein
VALVIERNGNGLAILCSLAAPDTVVVFGKSRHTGVAGILDPVLGLRFSEAVRPGNRGQRPRSSPLLSDPP